MKKKYVIIFCKASNLDAVYILLLLLKRDILQYRQLKNKQISDPDDHHSSKI
jgi:hypothetical protein